MGKTKSDKLDRQLCTLHMFCILLAQFSPCVETDDAVKKNNLKLVQKLVEAGANPNATVGKHGRNAMVRAAALKDRAIEELLISKGGVVHASNSTLTDSVISFQEGRGSPMSDSTMASSTQASVVEEPRKPAMFEDNGEPVSPNTARRNTERSKPAPFKADEDKPPLLPESSSGYLQVDKNSVPKQHSYTEMAEPAKADGDWSGMPDAMETPAGQAALNEGWELDRNKIKQVKKLGEGHFGVVFEGEAKDLKPGQGTRRVAVKMLTDSSSDAQEDFRKEVSIMQNIDGDHNIVRLLGICTEAAPYLMVIELMPNGDLKTLLRNHRPKSSKPSKFSLQQLMKMAADVAEGMAYISSIKIVHRDLAARNCLVDENYTAKVADFGLGRDTYTNEYYRMTGSNPLPVRWMAPEAIEDGVYTSESDVWSFGIVLYELITFAKMPYAGLSNMEVVDRVTDDYRLPQPKECPDGLYTLMRSCWDDAEDRPTFAELEKQLLAMADKAPKQAITKVKRASSRDAMQVTATGNVYDETQRVDAPADTYSMPQDAVTAIPAPTGVHTESDDEEIVTTDEGVAYQTEASSSAAQEEQTLYADERLKELSNIEQAIAKAKEANEVQQVARDNTSPAPAMSTRTVEEYTVADQKPESGAAAAMRNRWENVAQEEQKRANDPATLAYAEKAQKRKMTMTSEPEKPKAERPKPINASEPAKPVTPPSQRKDKGSLPPGETTISHETGTAYDAGGTEIVPSRNHLANDMSATAAKAAQHREGIRRQAFKEMQTWIDSVIGDYTEGESLYEILRTGEILCVIMNKIKPKSIPKIHHNPRLNFHMMENIGYFLLGAREYGLRDSELFITVDLFNQADMQQVVNCLSALKKLAESRGFRV
eukprot:TRINITY_DN12265_c0_g2_i9.p1 TRINITY_DN12265_c0_g2~~TRINITY_DN12265_c0_g2_i9.p1  ORF type:complete len:880 (+),score=275.69 TRINITY_DN12265_c0_g2_i9:255-2894(+)